MLKTLKPLKPFYSFNNNTLIMNKLIFINMVIFVIPLFCMSFIFYYKFQYAIRDEVITSYEQVMNQYVDNVSYKLELYNNLTDSIAFDEAVQEAFAIDYSNDYQKQVESLDRVTKYIYSLYNNNFNNMNQQLFNIMVYPSKSDISYMTNFIGHSSGNDIEEINKLHYKRSLLYNGSFETKDGNRTVMKFQKAIPRLRNGKFTEILGLIKIDFFSSSIFSTNTEFYSTKGENLYILDENCNEIYSITKREKPDFTKYSEKLAGASGNGFLDLSGKRSLYVYKTIQPYKWKAVMVYDNNIIGSRLREVVKSIILINVILFLAAMVLIIGFSKNFSSRVNLLIKKMKNVKKGNLNVNCTIYGSDEIAVLDSHFDEMIEKIKELIEENYIKELEKTRAQLRAFQLQINPHFLYNVLESINGIAAVYDCEEISFIAQKLGTMFRYNMNFEQGEYSLLKDEIEHIKNYEEIIKIQYDNNIQIHYEIPVELENYPVLRFMLQPIVENAVQHAFTMKKSNRNIEITACCSEGDLIIKVEDDGCGMSEEELSRLTAYVNGSHEPNGSTRRRSLGLSNIQNRIKLCYGEEYGLEIRSIQNTGTSVAVRIKAAQQA